MREILCTLVLIALAAANNSTKQLNATAEESTISKRYIVSVPQYNSLLYTNSQVLPTQQLLFGNSQALVNYINSIQLRTAPYDIPNYYILPRNNFIQAYPPPSNVVHSLQGNVVPAIPQNTISQQVVPKQKLSQQVIPQLIQQQIIPQVLRQQVIPQQVLKQQAVQQQIVPQLLRQQIVPQQIVPHVLRQQVVPQQIVPQALRQQVVPQQIVPQVLRQQVIPQQILRQQIIPQQQVPQFLVPQQIVPQQVLQQLISQQALRQQVVPQQIIPQPVLKQQILPEKIVPRPIQTTIPAVQSQPVSAYYQNNVVTPLIQQRIGPVPLDLKTPLPQQYYQPEPPRNRVAVGSEPYPYEVPPGQSKIPTTKQLPVYTKVSTTVPQVEPASRIQNLIYSNTNSDIPISYLQGQVNSQPQPVYGPPYLQTPNDVQQEVRIGYGHGNFNEEEIIGRGQEGHRTEEPHTVYANPSLFSSENNQAVVRIGYGPLDQQVGHQSTDNGPQQIKLDFPISYEGGSSGYQYEGHRPARTTDVNVKNQTELKEAERKT